jgi:hypothetical protein
MYALLPQDLEGPVAISAVAIDRKVVVEARDPRDAEPLRVDEDINGVPW